MTGPEVVKEIKRYVSAISECAKRTERITELVAQMVSGATEEIPPENEEPELSEEGEVQKILNGTKPKDIPIEFGAKSILILHLGRAQAAGIQFPESILSIANEKIFLGFLYYWYESPIVCLRSLHKSHEHLCLRMICRAKYRNSRI